MRGKHNATHQSIADNRITPAGAGKTRRDRKGEITTWDHPRRCGENPTAQTTTFLPTGSPPQVRGKLHPTEGTLSAFRITPAGAGKTLICRPKPAKPWDHPRRCGENPIIRVPIAQRQGSPPQVRGKHFDARIFRSMIGITPAGAGKTASGLHKAKGGQDHPRRCGENVAILQYLLFPQGSPPQVRGKLGACRKNDC